MAVKRGHPMPPCSFGLFWFLGGPGGSIGVPFAMVRTSNESQIKNLFTHLPPNLKGPRIF